MATSGKLIRVEHVVKSYNHGAVMALNDCSLTIQKGEVVAIIGTSSRFRHRSRVDLPEPEGPMMATTSPLPMLREQSFRAMTAPWL